METVRTVQLRDSEWLRGEGDDMSYLYREHDQKMCCIGIALRECGIAREKMAGVSSVYELQGMLPETGTLPDWADHGWVRAAYGINDEEADEDYGVPEMTPEERVQKLNALLEENNEPFRFEYVQD